MADSDPAVMIAAFLVALFVLLLLSAFFSGTETAFYSLDAVQKSRLSRSGARGELVLDLLEKRQDRLLSTILFGNTLVNIVASSIAAILTRSLFPGPLSLVLSVLVMTFLILVLGEIAPKAYAFSNNAAWASRAGPAVAVLVRLFRPASSAMSLLARIAHHIVGGRSRSGRLVESELVSLVEMGYDDGLLGAEAAVTASLLSLHERQCREVMVPRSSVSAVRTDWSVERLIGHVRESHFSRFPVLDGPSESVRGYVLASEVLLAPSAGGGPVGHRTIRVPLHEMGFFPENASLDIVLEGLRAGGEPMGAVVDEYGDWVGLVTLSDILALAVFESMRPEGDLPEGVTRRGMGYVVPGSMSLELLSSLLDSPIDAEYAESCGGLLEEMTGRIPSSGERMTHAGFQFHVLSCDGRSVDRVEVRPATTRCSADGSHEPDREEEGAGDP